MIKLGLDTPATDSQEAISNYDVLLQNATKRDAEVRALEETNKPTPKTAGEKFEASWLTNFWGYAPVKETIEATADSRELPVPTGGLAGLITQTILRERAISNPVDESFSLEEKIERLKELKVDPSEWDSLVSSTNRNDFDIRLTRFQNMKEAHKTMAEMPLTEALAYSMRFSGIKTKQISIAMSFVSSTLLISRLSNMFQAPLLGKMVDETIRIGTPDALSDLELVFRAVIFSGFIGVLVAMLLTPTFVKIFELAINSFLKGGSLPRLFIKTLFSPKRWLRLAQCFTIPKISHLKDIKLQNIPKTFLVLNIFVTSIYSIGVLASLLAGAMIPDLRATAIQLSGVVNGIATILFTLMVDPSGARVTDQAIHQKRPLTDVKAVIFYLQLSRMFGILIMSQLLFIPATKYIISVTHLIP